MRQRTRDPEKRFTKVEKSWITYDWANSVYATNIMAAIFPIFYASMATDQGNKWWGIGVSIASLVSAVLAPTLGAIADFKGYKKKLLAIFVSIGVLFTAALAFVMHSWQLMLIGYVISRIGFSGSCVFYDSFLTDVTTHERMDRVSSWGYAMGYIGGSTIPFVISIAMLLLSNNADWAIQFSILITSVWWAVFSLPMLLNVKQVHYVETPPKDLAKNAGKNLWETLKHCLTNKGLLFFLLAYFLYIDGVDSVISLATNYGSTLGLGSTGMILALLVTQIVAVPFSILFSRLADKFGSIKIIITAIVVYFCICGVGFFMGRIVEPYQIDNVIQGEAAEQARQTASILFWVLAALVGTVQGGIQALSRSYFGKLVPRSRSAEYFGFFDVFGRFAAVIGPLLYAMFYMLTNRASVGILSLLILFGGGMILLIAGRKELTKTENAAREENERLAALEAAEPAAD